MHLTDEQRDIRCMIVFIMMMEKMKIVEQYTVMNTTFTKRLKDINRDMEEKFLFR